MSMFADGMRDFIHERVKDYFERKIANAKDGNEQVVLATLAREVLAVINQS